MTQGAEDVIFHQPGTSNFRKCRRCSAALFLGLRHADGQPAVWIVDPTSLNVSRRDVELVNKNSLLVGVSKGLDGGESSSRRASGPSIGQTVRLLGNQQ